MSAEFLGAVRGSHEAVTRVRLVTPGQTGVNPDGVELAVIDGSVTLDGSADIRTSGDLTVSARWSEDGRGLAPYGQEIYVERGISFGNGRREFVGLGYLRLTNVDQDTAPSGPLRVTAVDRMAGLIEARMLAPTQFLAGQTLANVVASLVTEVYPDAAISWDDSTSAIVLARTQVVEEDRHGFLRELVTSHGKVWYFDHRGVLVIQSPPDPTSGVFDIDAGANGVLVSISRGLSREGVYNAVVASGEAADEISPPYAVAYDDDPASLTRWDGPFGKVPTFFTSPFITTTGQAAGAAATMLAQTRGVPYEVSFGMVPNVALEPLDAVEIVYPTDPNRSISVRRETHVLATLTIPLSAGPPMTATTRLQMLVL